MSAGGGQKLQLPVGLNVGLILLGFKAVRLSAKAAYLSDSHRGQQPARAAPGTFVPGSWEEIYLPQKPSHKQPQIGLQ